MIALLAACPEHPDLFVVEDLDAGQVDAGSSDSGIDPCAGHVPQICYGADPSTSINPPCRPGITSCVFGRVWCWGEVTPTEDICGDGIDNDCNGTIDDGIERIKPLDVVIIIDRSVSMFGWLSVVRANLERLVLTTPANYFFIDIPGVLGYGPAPNSVCYPGSAEWPIERCPNPTEAVHRLSTHQGGTELSYDAIWGVTRQNWIVWTPGASRVILLLTDEPGQSLGGMYDENSIGPVPGLQSYVLVPEDFDDLGPVLPLDYPIEVAPICE